MAKFRKKPVVVEAFQLTSSEYPNDEEVSALHAWTSVHGLTNWFSDYDGGVSIPTPEGVMRASPGDWIIKGVSGEFYPIKPDIFAKTYEEVI